MSYSSYDYFSDGFKEIQTLIRIASDASAQSQPNQKYSDQQSILRAVAVFIAGLIEGFLKTMLLEFIDEISGAWHNLSHGQQRYIVSSIRDNIYKQISEQYSVSQFSEPKKIDKFVNMLQKNADIIINPGNFARNDEDVIIEGFYKDVAPRSIEKTLLKFRSDEIVFFSWIESKGFDRSRYWTVLKALVDVRNQVAHGQLDVIITSEQIEDFLEISKMTVILASIYLREQYW